MDTPTKIILAAASDLRASGEHDAVAALTTAASPWMRSDSGSYRVALGRVAMAARQYARLDPYAAAGTTWLHQWSTHPETTNEQVLAAFHRAAADALMDGDA